MIFNKIKINWVIQNIHLWNKIKIKYHKAKIIINKINKILKKLNNKKAKEI